MKININLIRQMSIFSALIGAIVGVIALIPIIGNLIFTLFYIALSAILIVYLKRNNILGELTIKEGGILGAIIGTTATTAFLIIHIPLASLIQFIFNNGWIGQIIIACFSSFLAFFCLIFMLVFVIMLAALMNGFSGAATVYVYDVISKLKQD